MALAVAIVLGWAVAFETYRLVEVFAPTLLVAFSVHSARRRSF
jgi:hypothetical protein